MTKVLKTSIIFTFLSLTASALNLLYYPVISHLLSASEFGDVQIGISFIMLAAALFSSLNTLALYLTASSKSDPTSIFRIEKIIIVVSVFLAAITIAFAVPISHLLKLENYIIVYLLSAIFLINIPAATWIGSLQGNGQFVASGAIGVASSIVKIIISALLIYSGGGVFGALIGMFVGVLCVLPLVKLFQTTPAASYRRTLSRIRKEDFSYLLHRPSIAAILISLVALSSISTLDVAAAKILLSREEAGVFSQASVAAKIPYFCLLPIAIVLFERFVKKSIPLTRTIILFTLCVAATAVALFAVRDMVLLTIFNHSGNMDAFCFLLVAFSVFLVITVLAYAIISENRPHLLVGSTIISLLVIIYLLWSVQPTSYAISEAYCKGMFVALCAYGGAYLRITLQRLHKI